MVEVVTALAVVLLAAGVLASVLPLVPAGLLSLAGVLVYRFLGPAPGGTAMGPLVLAGFVLVAVLVVVVDLFGGAVGAKAGGASTRTTALAGLASLVLLFVVGPLGIVVGVVGVVLAAELYAGAEPAEALRTGAVTLVGMLASSLAQAALTLSMLVAFLAYVFLF